MKLHFWWQILCTIIAIALRSNDALLAQVVSDGTLPPGERSQVRGNFDFQIDGGAVRGSNLFHSFQQFSIPTNGSVFFKNSSTIKNIINRVTGSNISNIDGSIRANGNANLFLINPNGILFGKNASLNIGGSFVASTADGVVFGNKFTFSASDPQAPPLLTANVPIGLQYGSNPGAIQIRRASLEVPDGQTLTLAGGTVNLNGGELLALGGRVELAGIGASGEVGLTQQGQEWRLSVPEGLTRADIALVNDTLVDVRAGGSGSIAITARNLTGKGVGTQVRSGIAEGLGTADARSGDIDINATAAINLDKMFISNRVQPGGTGNAGNVNITTGSLSLINGARVDTSLFGRGDAGNINITATDTVSFDGESSNGFSSGAFSSVSFDVIGRGGNIRLDTGSLSLTNGAVVSTSTFGRGDAGNINITARDTVSFDGENSNGFSSGAFSAIAQDGIGRGGNIRLDTGSLSLTNGAVVSTSTFGRGDSGNITIKAKDTVSFDGENSNRVASGAYSSVNSEGIGRGGDISINTGSLFLTNGAIVLASVFGRGDAGNIDITATDKVSFDGATSDGRASGADSSVSFDVIGRGGDISITTGTLSLTNGAVVSTSTFGRGDSGNITITAIDAVFFDGATSDGFTSGVNSSVGGGGIGRGGDITINTGSLSLTNGGEVFATTFGRGDAGNITITATDGISIDGEIGFIEDATGFKAVLPSGVFSEVGLPRAIGRGGDITIDTGFLSLSNGGVIIADTVGRGDAGNITISATDAISFDGARSNGFPSGAFSGVGGAFNEVFPKTIGRGGDITINTGSLSLTNGAVVFVSTSGRGDAGNIDITATDAVSFDGKSSDRSFSGAFSTVNSGAIGRGGKIRVNTELFSIANRAKLSVSSEGQGDAGNIEVTANQLRLDKRGFIQAQTRSGQGGNIALNVEDSLLLRRGSVISTTAGTARSGGDGGNITFNGNFIVAVPKENSDISANAFTGQGGQVEINAQGIFGIQSRPELTRFSDITASSEFGISGTVTLNTPDVDPSRGLESLPTALVDPDALIANSCLARSRRQGSFTIAGSGGLAAQPDDLANSSFPTYELVPDPAPAQTIEPSREAIVETDGIYRLANGELVLGRSCH